MSFAPIRPARRLLLVAALTTATLATACSDGGGNAIPDAGPGPECNPLGGSACVMPFPSSIYEVDDATTATGRRVDLPEGVLPTNQDRIPIRSDWFNTRDGWSANMPIIAAFASGMDGAGLASPNNIAASLSPDSPTVLLGPDGQRVAHIAELDVGARGEVAQQALIIRSASRLAPGSRYVVALRRSLRAVGGGELAISPGFQSLLDGTTTTDARLERVRPRYVETFAALEAAGVPKGDLVLAWDFTTASDELVRRDMLEGRDAMLAAAGELAANVTFEVTSDEPDGDPTETLRIVRGTFTGPSVLTEDDDDGVLARDADGHVVANGTIAAPFSLIIPACAADPANRPLPVVVYGHGLMGGQGEVTGGYVRFAAQYQCKIFVGTNWRGMSETDITSIAMALNDVNKGPYIFEKLVQGVNQFILLEQLVRGPFAASPVFAEGGVPLIDPTRVYYYGISQGGIFGGTFMSYDPFVTRGVLGVPAANYSMMLERSTNWPIYELILRGAYPNVIDGQLLLGLMQMHWDRTDPASTAPYLTGGVGQPLPGTENKQILLQMAVGDSQVANIATEFEARAMGISVLGPTPAEPYGLTVEAGPLSSAFTIWNEHREPTPPLTNSASADDNGTHGTLRKREKVNAQIKTFFDTGEIVQTCVDLMGQPAACDCSVDMACGPMVD